MNQQPSGKSAEEIRAWVLSQVAAELSIDATEIDVRKPLTRYGMDSMTAVVLTGELEQWLGCPVPPDLLGQYVTIESLAAHLAANAPWAENATLESATEPPVVESQVWEPRRPTLFKRFIQKLTTLLVRLLIRLQVEGLERIPPSGPFILASNHLHVIDTPVVFTVMRSAPVFFVSDHMLKFPLVGWYLRQLGQTIYVARGEADRSALVRALAVLQAGGTLAIAPEGRISRTRGLLRGQTGTAYIATLAAAPVVPIVAFGQEEAGRCWRRLRRVPMSVRVGAPVKFPPGKASTRQLEEYTEEIMLALARLLPEQYRGVYAGVVKGSEELVSTRPWAGVNKRA